MRGVGLWLVRDGDERLALMLDSVDMGRGEQFALEAMGAERARAESVIAQQRQLMAERNIYRGRVHELRRRNFHDDAGALDRPDAAAITRERIALADGVLERVERQAFVIARHAERPGARGRHLRGGCCCMGVRGPARR